MKMRSSTLLRLGVLLSTSPFTPSLGPSSTFCSVMPKFIRNPHEVVQPDFTSDDHAAHQQILTDGSLTEDQVVATLSNLWVATNKRDKAEWDCRQAGRAQEQLGVKWEEEREEEALLEASRTEERKRYKNMFAPVKAIGPVTILACKAITCMKKAEYIELWYFTNDGIRAVEVATTVPPKDSISFRFVYNEELDTSTLVPVSSLADISGANIVEDINLSWEQFMQAMSHIISFMEQCDWPQDHVNMFVEFWSNIQSHQWRHLYDEFSQRALLVYQGIQHKCWHIYIDTKCGWSLAEICMVTLTETHEDLVHKVCILQIKELQKVSELPIILCHFTVG